MFTVRDYSFSVGTTPQELTLAAVPSTFKVLFGGLHGIDAVISAIVDTLSDPADQRFMLFEPEQELITPGGAPIRKDDFIGTFTQGASTYFLFRRRQD